MGLTEVLKREFAAVVNNGKHHLAYHFFHETDTQTFYQPDRETVILLHGFMQSEAPLVPLARHLHDHGINSVLHQYSFIGGDLREREKELLATAHAYYQKDHKKLHLCGHSLGALFGLKTAIQNPDLFHKVIGISMPYAGTWRATLLPLFQSCRQMIPWSDYIRELQDSTIPPTLDIYSIYGEYDLVLGSIHRARISHNHAPSITNIRKKGYSHNSLLEPETYPLIVDILKK